MNILCKTSIILMGCETMTVKLEQYRIFKAIADTGNISRTAKQLYLSQSAVSQSLQQLESALGVRLFSRTARGVTLTAEGSVLYDYAAQALSLLEAGEARIAQSRELLKGELSIGVSSTLTKYYLLPFLRDYHQQYPHIHVRILNGTSRRVLQLLGSGQVELAFATYTPDADSFSVFPCFDTHTVFVAAPDYPCDFDRVYTLQEISEFPLILLEREASSRRFLEDCFLQRGLRLQPEIELASHNLLISLARIGLGVAGVTEELSLSGLNRGVVRKLHLAEEIPSRRVVLCTRRNTPPSAAAGRFHGDDPRPPRVRLPGGAGRLTAGLSKKSPRAFFAKLLSELQNQIL